MAVKKVQDSFKGCFYPNGSETRKIWELKILFMVATQIGIIWGANKAGLEPAYIKEKRGIYHPIMYKQIFKALNLPDLLSK